MEGSQLTIGERAESAAPPRFRTDDDLARMLSGVESGLVQVENGLSHFEALIPAMRRGVGAALEVCRTVRGHLAGS